MIPAARKYKLVLPSEAELRAELDRARLLLLDAGVTITGNAPRELGERKRGRIVVTSENYLAPTQSAKKLMKANGKRLPYYIQNRRKRAGGPAHHLVRHSPELACPELVEGATVEAAPAFAKPSLSLRWA